jgi:DNA-binding HxlR family transcriptional regulator
MIQLNITTLTELTYLFGRVTNATLSDRLKHLEANELVERRPYQTNPERSDYLLTDKGWRPR